MYMNRSKTGAHFSSSGAPLPAQVDGLRWCRGLNFRAIYHATGRCIKHWKSANTSAEILCGNFVWGVGTFGFPGLSCMPRSTVYTWVWSWWRDRLGSDSKHGSASVRRPSRNSGYLTMDAAERKGRTLIVYMYDVSHRLMSSYSHAHR